MVENKACFSHNVSTSLALLQEVRAAWPLIESAAEWETSSLRMKDEKKRCDSEGTGTTAVLQRVLLLAAAVSFFFSPSSATEVANAATQKTPAARKPPIKGVFSRHGRKSKKVILCLQAK